MPVGDATHGRMSFAKDGLEAPGRGKWEGNTRQQNTNRKQGGLAQFGHIGEKADPRPKDRDDKEAIKQHQQDRTEEGQHSYCHRSGVGPFAEQLSQTPNRQADQRAYRQDGDQYDSDNPWCVP